MIELTDIKLTEETFNNVSKQIREHYQMLFDIENDVLTLKYPFIIKILNPYMNELSKVYSFESDTLNVVIHKYGFKTDLCFVEF